MMRVWYYKRGDWRNIPDPFTPRVDLEEQLPRFAIRDTPELLFGDPDAFHVAAYAAEEDSVAVDTLGDAVVKVEFLAVVSTWASWYPVFVADLPSLVQLIGELRPLLASEREALDFEGRDRREEDR